MKNASASLPEWVFTAIMFKMTTDLTHANCVPKGVSDIGRRLARFLFFVGFSMLAGCASTSAPPTGLQAVSPFDLARYQGQWYELGRLDNWFERGLTNVSANYSAQADGTVRVVNRGFDPSAGQWREAVGKALFTGPASTASLKVSFFGPFYGGYHVVALDADYRWALVVGSDRSYCWILARDKQLHPAQRDDITARAKAMGIDTSALIWVSHDRQDPTH